MSAENNPLGIPDYARPKITKEQLDSIPNIQEQLFKCLKNDIREIQEGLGEDDCLLDENCPNCGHEYDEVDYEYQICHLCDFNNEVKTEKI